ncbi:MAG: GIN domain-containing protein [Bacteroidota bacterium]
MKTIFFKFGILSVTSMLLWTGCTKGPGTIPNTNPNPAVQPFYNIVTDGLCKVILVPGAVNHVDTCMGAGTITIAGKTLYAAGAGSATISIKDLDSLTANGASFVEAPATLNLDHVTITGNRYSKIILNLSASDSIAALCYGMGPYELSGNTPQLRLVSDGLGSFQAFNMITKNCNVNIIGAGKAEVYASNSLTATIHGLGVVYYKGNPPVVTPNILGLGFLVKK